MNATNIKMERCLTPKDVSILLGINKNSANSLFNNIAFPSFRVGKHWRILQSDFLAWIEKQKSFSGKRAYV